MPTHPRKKKKKMDHFKDDIFPYLKEKHNIVVDDSKTKDDVVILRANIKDPQDFVKFYGEISSTNWIVYHSLKSPERCAFHKKWVCHHHKRNKVNSSERNFKCESFIDIKTKLLTINTKKRDSFLRLQPPLTAVITICLKHSHPVLIADTMRKLRVTKEVQQSFFEYFSNGMSPCEAIRFHQASLLAGGDTCIRLADASKNPCARQVYYIYDKWRCYNLGPIIDPCDKLQGKISLSTESGFRNKTMKRGRKRKHVSAEEKKGILVPSSAILPARLLATTLPVNLPIKKEIKVERNSIPSDTDKTCRNTNEDGSEKNMANLPVNNTLLVNLPTIKKEKEEIVVETDSIPSDTNKTCENINEDGSEKNIATIPVNNTLPVNLPTIKKEKQEIEVETDSISSDTDKTCDININEDSIEKKVIRNLTSSKCREFPDVSQQIPQTANEINIEANNELSFNLQNLKPSEPVPPVGCTADSNYCEANVGNLDLTNLKREPRSRSSSTETVLADESQQLPLAECRSGTSTNSSNVVSQVTSVTRSSPDVGTNSAVSLSKETVDVLFAVPILSPNICVSKQKNSSMQKCTKNISFVAKLYKYSNFDIEIVKSDAKDCLNYLESTYTSKRRFNLFFSHDPFQRQHENPTSEHLQSSPINSSASTEVISIDTLKKIIEISSLLSSSNSSNLPIPHQNNSDRNTLAVSSSISHSPTLCTPMNKVTDSLTQNVRIKDESVDDYNSSSAISSPTVNPLVSTIDKMSSEVPTAEVHALTKKIKISPDLETELSIDTPISHLASPSDKKSSEETTTELLNLTEKISSVHSVLETVQSIDTQIPCSTTNKKIKDEPLDDCDASSVISSPTVSYLVSTRDKKSSKDTTIEMLTRTKKIKISPDMETGLSFDTPVSHLVPPSDKKSPEETTAGQSIDTQISCSPTNKKSGFTPDIHEPLDDYDASSLITSRTVSHLLLTNDKMPSNLPVPLHKNSENTNMNALSVPQFPTPCSPTKKKSCDKTPNISIKNEPLDDDDASSVMASPTVSHLVSMSEEKSSEETTTEIRGLPKKINISSVLETGQSINTQMKHTVSHRVSRKNKRPAKETTTERRNFKKKIKISPDHSLKTGCNIDTQIKPGDGNEKCDSIATTKGGIHNQSRKIGRTVSDTLKCWPLSPHNSYSDRNKVSDTENTMSSSKSIPCIEQSDVDKNLTVTSNELFNPKIRKTKPLGDSKTHISTVFQQSLTTCRRSTLEADNDIHQVLKINTVTEQDHSAVSGTNDGVATSKVTNNRLRNNVNMSHVPSVSDSKNSKDIESISFKSVASKPISYLHLVPQNIHKTVLCTDKAPNTNLRPISSAEPSTSVPSNFTVVTTVSDSNINSNSTNYSQRTQVINKFLACSAMQHAGKTNLGDDRNLSHVSNPLACNRINTQNYSQPCIISPNNATTKKTISANLYFQRKSSLHLRCAQKNSVQNSVSQISSPDSSVQPVVSLEKQQNNCTPIAYVKKAPQCNKSTSASRTKIALNVQHKSYQNVSSESISMVTAAETSQRSVTSSCNQNQVIAENSIVSHNPPRRSTEFLAITSRDPRKPYLRSYQTEFEPLKQDFSSILRRDTAGNKFIDTKDLPKLILNWNVSWLSTQKKLLKFPPIWDNYLQVKDTYQCIQDYYDTYQPLHLLNIWCNIYDAWEKSKVFCNNVLIYEAGRSEEFVKISCTVILNATDRSNWLKKEDILICSSADNTRQNFGRIVNLTEHDYYPSSSYSDSQTPGVRKKLYLEIMCAPNFTIKPLTHVRLQNLINISIALKQNDALKCTNPAMWSIVLNPKQNERLLQTVCVPPIENFSSVTNSVRSLQHRVTIVNTSTPPESVSIILLVTFLFKTDSIIIVGVKDEETFLLLASEMKNHVNTVLAIREDEVSQLPPELRGHVVKNCDSETLKSCQVVLTLIPSMFFGEIEGRLTKESIICVIHEAQSFFETETALLLAYKVEHLILTGRPNVKAITSPMLSRYLFDVSLFHRISMKK